MAVLKVSDVLKRFDAAMSLDATYHRSRWLLESFGSDAESYQHLAYAISAPTSEISDFTGRGIVKEQGEANTTVLVAVAYRIRATSKWEDYLLATDSEQVVAQRLLAMDERFFTIHYRSVPTRVLSIGGEWLMSTLRFETFHRYQFEEV